MKLETISRVDEVCINDKFSDYPGDDELRKYIRVHEVCIHGKLNDYPGDDELGKHIEDYSVSTCNHFNNE